MNREVLVESKMPFRHVTDDQVKDFVLRLTRPELEELTTRLDINPGFLEHSAPAARAGEIWNLATRPGGKGVEGIRAALEVMHPTRGFAPTAPPSAVRISSASFFSASFDIANGFAASTSTEVRAAGWQLTVRRYSRYMRSRLPDSRICLG
jgi:hypothetical protein